MLGLDMCVSPRTTTRYALYPEKCWLTGSTPRVLIRLAGKALTPRKVQLLEIASGRSLEAMKRVDQADELAQCDLIRELIDNPFRLIALDPMWRTDTVTALASQMYATRDFSAMPILADALQDADCSDEAILQHCRGPVMHIRGCFLIDAILGRS